MRLARGNLQTDEPEKVRCGRGGDPYPCLLVAGASGRCQSLGQEVSKRRSVRLSRSSRTGVTLPMCTWRHQRGMGEGPLALGSLAGLFLIKKLRTT